MAESPITMFGAYVKNLSVSLGWGGQGGSMQLTLVEDETNDVVIPKDENGYPFYGSDDSPQTGTACYFKYGNFYFGGIFQRWTYKEDAVNGRTYDVVLESPSKYMDGVQLIIENFNGAYDRFANQFNNFEVSTNMGAGFHATYGAGENGGGGSIYNVFNLFGAFENPFYGPTVYNNFGLSGFRSDGMPLGNILFALDVLIERSTSEPFGGPIVLGETNTGGAASLYGLNVDALVAFFTSYGFSNDSLNDYSIQGPVKSVNGLFGELAELFQFDFYFDIQPAVGVAALAEGGGKLSEADIYLRVTDKAQPPEPNKIRQFIQSELAKPDHEKIVMSYSLGKEFSTAATQKIVWGARRSRYLEINPSVQSGAIWGKTSSVVSNSYNVLPGYAGSIYSSLDTPHTIYIEGFGSYSATPFEMRMAMGGKECWQTFKTMETIKGVEPNGENDPVTAPWSSTTDFTSAMLNLLNQDIGNAYDLINTNFQNALKQWNGSEEYGKRADRIFSGVAAIANSSYKQEFLVSLPSEVYNLNYNIYYPTFTDSDGNAEYESESKKAWDVASSAFIDIRYYSPTIDVGMFDSDGKLESLVGYPLTGTPRTVGGVGYPGSADLSALGSDYAFGTRLASGLVVSKKGSPETETYWAPNWFDTSSGALQVVFKTGCAPKDYDGYTTPDFGLTVLSDLFFGIAMPPEKYIGTGKTSLQFQIPPDTLMPSYFGIPQESQRFNYGPWATLVPGNSLGIPGFYSPFGLAEAQETELAPETYGGYSNLQRVGSITAQVADSSMHESESGYCQVVGAPSVNLGERFQTTGPYVTNMDISVDAVGGVTTTYKFNTWTPEFGKIAKYNIDRIAKTNKTAWTKAQRNRGKINKPPFPKIKFEKTDFKELQREKQAFVDNNGWKFIFGIKDQVNQGNVN